MKNGQRAKLICPECLGDDLTCERCKGSGMISVIVPEGGVSPEAASLIVPAKRPGLLARIFGRRK